MQVTLRDGETFESLLRRFKAGVARDGILSDFRRSQAFISKGERIRMKIRKAERRRLRKSSRRSGQKPEQILSRINKGSFHEGAFIDALGKT